MRRAELEAHEAQIVAWWVDEERSASWIAKQMKSARPTIKAFLEDRGFEVHKRIRGWDSHGYWKGGRRVDNHGYVAVRIPPDDPRRELVTVYKSGYALEHRLVMAEALGRPLEKGEQVHHKNGDRADNRLENLQLRKGAHGPGASFRCADCGSHNVEAVDL